MKFNDKIFREAMRDKKITVRKMAAHLGLNHHSQLLATFTGNRRLQLDEAITMSKVLGIPLNIVIANAGHPEVMQQGKRLPVIGILRGNGELEDVPANTERTLAPDGFPNVVSALQARTRDTPLQWMDRWVFYCEEKGEPNQSMLGRYCHVKIKNGPRVMATLRLGYAVNTYGLSGPYSADSAVIEWAAPVALIRT